MRLLFVFFVLAEMAIAQSSFHSGNVEESLSKVLTRTDIYSKKIKRIIIDEAIKSDNNRIHKTGRQFILQYDTKGLPVWMAELTSPDVTDTILTTWYRTRDSTLLVKRKFERGRFESTYIRYDSLHRPSRYVNCSETGEGDNPRYFKPMNQYVHALETMEYELTIEGHVKKKFKNDNGVLYKEGFEYFRNGKPFSEEYFFVATGMRVRINYRYDEQGHLAERQYYTDATGEYTETTEFKYEKGQLSKERLFRNTVPLLERFYFYRSVDGLPESILSRNTSSYDIYFLNLRYEFYP